MVLRPVDIVLQCKNVPFDESLALELWSFEDVPQMFARRLEVLVLQLRLVVLVDLVDLVGQGKLRGIELLVVVSLRSCWRRTTCGEVDFPSNRPCTEAYRNAVLSR